MRQSFQVPTRGLQASSSPLIFWWETKITCKPRKDLKSTCKLRRGLELFASLFALRVIVPVIHIHTEKRMLCYSIQHH